MGTGGGTSDDTNGSTTRQRRRSGSGERTNVASRTQRQQLQQEEQQQPTGAASVKNEAKGGPLVVAAGIFFVLAGCGVNNFVLEMIVNPSRNEHADPGAGPLLTVLQFAFISLLSAVYMLDWPGADAEGRGGEWGIPSIRQKLRIPFRHYVGLTALFCAMSVANNYAFKLHISQPTHLVIRSTSLVASVILGYLAFGKTYKKAQYAAVVLITVGVIVATLAEVTVGDTAIKSGAASAVDSDGVGCVDCPDSAPQASAALASDGAGADADAELAAKAAGEEYMGVWLLGVGLLVSVLGMSALLGQYQEFCYASYKRDWREMMFFNHFLAIPMFAIGADGLMEHARLWSASPPTAAALAELTGLSAATLAKLLPLGLSELPVMWFWLIANVVTQYVCVRAVFMLGGAAGALTMTMSLTVRKFLSLIVSVWYFGNTFTTYHWVGTLAVFAGVFVNVSAKKQGKSDSNGKDEAPASGKAGKVHKS